MQSVSVRTKVFFTCALAAGFLIALLPGCSDNGKNTSLAYDSSPGSTVVRYWTGGGLSPPWVDNAPRFVLYGDGRVVYASGVRQNAPLKEGKLAPDQVESLLRSIRETGFFGLNDQYINRKVMDAASSDITVNLKNDDKKVHVYMVDVKPYKQTVELLGQVKPADEYDYVPQAGYLVVRSESQKDTRVIEPGSEAYSLIPDTATFQQSADGRKPIPIPGDSFIKLKQLESGQQYAGLVVTKDGQTFTLYPLYEPTGR